MSSTQRVAGALAQAGIDISNQAAATLDDYIHAIIGYRANRLVATADYETILNEHIVDSCRLFPLISRENKRTLVDIGSGAGLPGIVLKILDPSLSLMMIESNGKRCSFLRERIIAYGLTDTVVLQERVEIVGRMPAYRGAFDAVTARALAKPLAALEYAVPLLSIGGVFYHQIGQSAAGELEIISKKAEILGARLSSEPLVLAPDRLLLCFQKREESPDRYPRRVVNNKL